ncbi:MAG: long-chain-fatty-acid--CoA ligase [Acidobacteria bacterium]|nr:long-chain-fatty-acid--CoA ligase [Acidobacteriota bacterium]
MKISLTPLRFLERAARLYGNKESVVCGEESFTYAEFADRCRRLAGGVRALGVRSGECVAVLSWNCHRLLESYFGVPMAAAVLLPLNVRLAATELAAILRDSDARVLFYDVEFAALVEGFRAEAPQLEHFIPLTAPPRTTDNEERTEFPSPFPGSYDDLVEWAAPLTNDCTDVNEDAIAEMFYTSGTTGAPKGVMLSHRTLYLHALNALIAKQYTEDMAQVHTIPLYHANGWGNAHMLTAVGARHILLRKFEPAEVCRLVEREKVTALCLVPTMAILLLEYLETTGDRHDLSSLEWTELGGAAASPELIQRMEKTFGCLCYCGYGLTESGPVLSISRFGDMGRGTHESEQARRKAMTGREIIGAELRVVDEQGGAVAKDGRTMGEIVARGDGVFDGYWENPIETDAALRDGWLHTGDMAVWDEQGFVQIVDRKKEIIISGGENISSLEIERALAAHPDVLECAVIAIPDAKWGEVPKALVVLRKNATTTVEHLNSFLGGKLAQFKIPRQIEFISALPKGGTGKIMKKLLRQPR